MRTIIGCLLVTLFSANMVLGQSDLKVISFNLRYDNPSDTVNPWNTRQLLASDLLNQFQPDLIGFQEVLKYQLDSLLVLNPDFAYVGVGRDDGQEKGEYCPIFYRSDRFELVDQGTFWLSESPDEPGMGWDAVCNRICTWVKLKDNSTGKSIFMANTHYDHKGRISRKESTFLLLKRLKKLSGKAQSILTGDLNAGPTSSEIRWLLDKRYIDTFAAMGEEAVGPEGTFHNWGRILPEFRNRIDYILVGKSWKVKAFITLDQNQEGKYPSDHFPVFATLE
ncbi:MAG: endonuclease/exonuclease/phosphatase family protein [Bacteroidota bacterium]